MTHGPCYYPPEILPPAPPFMSPTKLQPRQVETDGCGNEIKYISVWAIEASIPYGGCVAIVAAETVDVAAIVASKVDDGYYFDAYLHPEHIKRLDAKTSGSARILGHYSWQE